MAEMECSVFMLLLSSTIGRLKPEIEFCLPSVHEDMCTCAGHLKLRYSEHPNLIEEATPLAVVHQETCRQILQVLSWLPSFATLL